MEQDNLTFWVAYQPDGDKHNYLGDGQGHIRLFKTQEAIQEFLKENMSPEELEKTVVHSVVGKIAVPEPEPEKPITIRTLAADMPPTAREQLRNLLKQKRIK